MISSLIAQFWPFIIAGLGVFAGVLGFRSAENQRAKRKKAEREMETHKRMRKHEQEASRESDSDLIDRITK